MRRSDLQETDDTGLIVRAAKGDREAFGDLYERYVFRVFRHVYYLTNNTHTAEDLTAQTFLNALEAIHRYEVRGVTFLAWLLRIAYNLTMNHKKLRSNGNSPLPEGSPSTWPLAATTNHPHRGPQARDLAAPDLTACRCDCAPRLGGCQ